MPKSCVAFGCSNHNMKKDRVSFHVFPKDESRRQRWIIAVRRQNTDGTKWEPSAHAVLCGKHFIGGKPNGDPSHPDFVPSIFVHRPLEAQKPLNMLGRYKARKKLQKASEESGRNDVSAGLDHSLGACCPLWVKETNTMNEVDFHQQLKSQNMHLGELLERKNLGVHRLQDHISNQAVLAGGVQQLMVIKEEVPHERSLSLDQQDLEVLHIKEEPEEMLTSQEEQVPGLKEEEEEGEEHSSSFLQSGVTVKKEDEDERADSSRLNQTEPSSCSSGEPAETDRNTDCVRHLQSNTDGRDLDSSETEVSFEDEDDEEWQEPLSDSGPENEDGGNAWKQRSISESAGQDGNLRRRRRVHTGEKPYSCSVCGKRFTRHGDLKRHKRVHTGEKPFGCSVCGKKFRQQGVLKSHVRIHTGEKPFACDLCGKRFIHQSNLKSHTRVHTGEKPFGCGVCGKSFTEQGSLRRHRELHTGQKSHSCGICGKKFSRKAHFKIHMTVHTGEKPFECGFCGKRFSQKTHFKIHMKVHTGEKPFSCDICGRRFRLQFNLKRHKRVHTGEKPFTCGVCGERFTEQGSLKRHSGVHTGEKPFACHDCGKTFSRNTHLKRHLRVHTGERPFACDVCGERFTEPGVLRSHVRVHTGETPFGCDACGKKFRHQYTLKRHRSVHTGMQHHSMKSEQVSLRPGFRLWTLKTAVSVTVGTVKRNTLLNQVLKVAVIKTPMGLIAHIRARALKLEGGKSAAALKLKRQKVAWKTVKQQSSAKEVPDWWDAFPLPIQYFTDFFVAELSDKIVAHSVDSWRKQSSYNVNLQQIHNEIQ